MILHTTDNIEANASIDRGSNPPLNAVLCYGQIDFHQRSLIAWDHTRYFVKKS